MADFAPLPNEVLITIFSLFPTRELLPITPTSRRIYSLILRILHARLVAAGALADHKLILECSHPSSRFSTPYFFCEYLGTASLDAAPSLAPIKNDGCANTEALSLAKLHGLYSYYRPIRPDSSNRETRSHPAGGSMPALPTSNALNTTLVSELVCQNIHLDSHELFSQLCTITNLVKVGPKKGLFLSSVNIGDSILRVWRNWLGERCSGVAVDRDYEKRLLWAGSSDHVGLRMRVKEREDLPPPVVVRSDEDVPVSYTLQYEELLIRTTQLLLVVEQSIEQEVTHSGKATVIGSW